ncbi:cytochrome c oxidase subunit III (mitochondrion) [Apis laboriosa]|uniref:Cytochrome c oxidase subunit 3 n=1 Tax=Apis laboriosa TaxID=183418 RepID=A0A292GED5_9HYME|nr:cytochrome c oxidase subunit III [Apis laboriosa]ARR27630.1 cytochrome c oxidase subunit III [Apis laboriosa]WDY83684.1 cytochrome coxidase subunit III [Apis laboriosa]BBA66254.1 cytochrome c oxidase subunit III [Apis laboriosa]
MKKNFPFHMVTFSPWPIILSFSLLNTLISTAIWIYSLNYIFFMYNLINSSLITMLWFRDIIRESTFQGLHTNYIINFLKFSMILFIISELMFFISFFWTFFHSSISPNIEVDMTWPPKDIKFFNPFEIPLLNSFILVTSGFTVTLSHYFLIKNYFNLSKFYLMLTIFLGFYFTILQSIEYLNSFFCFNDSIYGSIFFMATGFHGLHVLIGSIFLFVSLYRMMKIQFSNMHNINFELAIWYWHFVDVIWLFLYTFIYMLI